MSVQRPTLVRAVRLLPVSVLLFALGISSPFAQRLPTSWYSPATVPVGAGTDAATAPTPTPVPSGASSQSPSQGAEASLTEGQSKEMVHAKEDQDEAAKAARHWIARLTVSGTYDDNVTITSGPNKKKDFIWSVNPEVGYQFGKKARVLVEYSPNILLFTNHSEFDGVDHNALASIAVGGERLTLSASQTYSRLNGPNVQVGDRIRRTLIGTSVGAAYLFTEKTSTDAYFSQSINDYDTKLDSKTWMAGGYFNYHLSPKVRVGIGPAVGWTDMQGPNQMFEQARARLAYNATEKLTFDGYVGAEWRQFQDPGGAPDSENLVFGAGGTWIPREGTIINLRAYRNFESSPTQANQNILMTGFGTSISQQFAQRYTASLSGGYEFDDYEATAAGTAASRRDSFFYLSPSFAMAFNKWWTGSVYYRYSQNDSNTLNDFEDHQVGVSTTVSY